MPAGQPAKYATPELMQAAIDRYFSDDMPTRTGMSNGVSYKIPVPSISGLALYLVFCDRHSLYDYEKRAKFSHTLNAARARMTAYYEENTQAGSAPGSIFMLKNLGYSDKQELDISGKLITMPAIKVNGKELKIDIGDPITADPIDAGEASPDNNPAE